MLQYHAQPAGAKSWMGALPRAVKLEPPGPRSSDPGALEREIPLDEPQLFLPAFPAVAEAAVAPLARAARLLASSPSAAGGERQYQGDRVLADLFPAGSPFWERLRGYLTAQASALAEERQFARGERPAAEFSLEVALRIVRGKNGMARLVLAALAELAGDATLLPSLTESVLQAAVARQMVDDLEHWRQDFARGIPSLVLMRARRRALSQGPQDRPVDEGQIERAIYGGGVAGYILRIAVAAVGCAEHQVETLPELPWHRRLQQLRARIDAASDELSLHS